MSCGPLVVFSVNVVAPTATSTPPAAAVKVATSRSRLLALLFSL